MPWKKEKKSRSVNDIPVEKNHNNIIHSLDDGDFLDLLSSVSQPAYNQRSSGFLTFQGARDAPNNNKISTVKETSALVKVCEKGLRDEDAAREEEKRRQHQQKRGSYRSGCSSSSFDRSGTIGRIPSSPSVSPPARGKVPPPPAPYGNKPVDFGSMSINYIDDTGDVEMEDLSNVSCSSSSNKRYTQGNHEVTVHPLNEYYDDEVDVECGGGDRRYGLVPHDEVKSYEKSYEWPSDSDENKLQRDGDLLTRYETILPPHNEGMFSSLSYDMVGTDEVPKLTPSGMPLPHTAQLVRLDSTTGHITYDNKSQEAIAANAKLEGKRKKKKKEKESKGNTFASENVPGYMGLLPLEQLLNLIEGEPAETTGNGSSSGKKQKSHQQQNQQQQDVSSVVVASAAATPSGESSVVPASSSTGITNSSRKDINRRRKSKDGNGNPPTVAAAQKSKESSSSSASPPPSELSPRPSQPAATIGNQQQKAAAAAKKPQMDVELARDALKAQGSSNAKSSPKTSGASRVAARVSTASEDVEEEFLSADEGLAPSSTTASASSFAQVTSSSSKKPGKSVSSGRGSATIASSSSTAATSSSTTSVSSNPHAVSSDVMLDGANYRADYEDVTVIERHVVEEPEFITVSGGKTKKKGGSTSSTTAATGSLSNTNNGNPHPTTTRTGSAGKIDRRPRGGAYGGSSSSSAAGGGVDRRSSLEERVVVVTSPQSGQQQQKLSPRRPTTSLLADFIDDKKVDSSSGKHTPVKATRGSTPSSSSNQKKQPAARQSTADSDYQDAEEMATMTQMRGSPERAFSYADVAKKSSEQQSREHSPAGSVQLTSSLSPAPHSMVASPPVVVADSKHSTVPPSTSASTSTTTVTPASAAAATKQGAAELPPMPAGESSGGLSFFYDENAANRSDESIEAAATASASTSSATTAEDGAFVLNLGGKTVRFAKGMAASEQPVDGRIRQMTETMQQRWNEFNKGVAPIVYKSVQKS